MSLNKLLPAACLVFLATTAATTVFAGTCRYTGSTDLLGSTTETNRLDHFSYNSVDRIVNETCNWTITCPAGSFIGATNLDLSVYDGESVFFADVDDVSGDLTALDTWSTAHSAISATAYFKRRFLYTNTTKLHIQYNTTTTGSSVGFGFDLTYKCFTSTCPADLVSYKTYSATDRSGFELLDIPVAGTSCNFTFACASTGDRPQLNYDVGTYISTGWSMAIAGSSPSSSYTVPSSGSSHSQLAAATSYTVSFAGATSATDSNPSSRSTLSSNTDYLAVWAGCQAPSETECVTGMYRNGATVSGSGLFASDPDGEEGSSSSSTNLARVRYVSKCQYEVTCASGATSIDFTGALSSSSYGSVDILSNATATTSLKSFTSTTASTYTFSGTSAYIQMASTSATSTYSGGYARFSCAYSKCYSSSQSGLHNQTTSLAATTLRTDTLIPMTTESQVFNSDVDGASNLARLNSTQSGQECQFTATCPAGYYVILNVSGRFIYGGVGNDRIYATGGGEVYDFSYASATLPTNYASYYHALDYQVKSVTTKANSLTWTQSAHYFAVSGYGYAVEAGCTSFQTGTCPYSGASAHFGSLSTASLNTAVEFNSFRTSVTHPMGYSCSWPITCPAGGYIRLDFSSMAYYRGAVMSASNPNVPIFKNAAGAAISVAGSDVVYLGVSSATMNWDTTLWNTTNPAHSIGFNVEVSCTTVSGISTPTPSTTPSTPSPGSVTGGSTPSPVSPSPSTTGVALVSCPYSTTSWDLVEGIRHAMTFDFSTLGTDEYAICSFTFTCPVATTTGMAYKITSSPESSTRSLWTIANSTASTYGSTTATFNSTDTNLVTAKSGLQVSASGTGGSFSMLITCLTTPKVPANGFDVNYDAGTYICYYNCGSSSTIPSGADRPYQSNSYGYNYSNSIATASSSSYTAKSYSTFSNGEATTAVSRRSYTASQEKAFLISCYNKDMTQVLNVVQLDSITGSTGTSGDVLTITALDSGISKSFGGANTSISETFGRSANTTLFNASSQYYFTWSSDSTSESSPYNSGVTVSYKCGESETGFALAGIGSSVSNSLSGASSVSMIATFLVATVLLTVFA